MACRMPVEMSEGCRMGITMLKKVRRGEQPSMVALSSMAMGQAFM